MDLLATVRKEGSRGGRGEFKWSEVQGSSHREHYLGHSVMAPVGRWQKGRDLNWYSKANADDDDEDAAERAVRERREEIQRVKEAEQDAMAEALGLPVPQRNNANLEDVSDKRNFDKVLKDAVGSEATGEGQGVGFGRPSKSDRTSTIVDERIEGNAEAQDKELQLALREYKRRHGDEEFCHGSRTRSRDRAERRVRREGGREHRHRRHRHSSRSRERHHRTRPRSRSRSRSRSRDNGRKGERKERSRSPYRREERRHERRRRHD